MSGTLGEEACGTTLRSNSLHCLGWQMVGLRFVGFAFLTGSKTVCQFRHEDMTALLESLAWWFCPVTLLCTVNHFIIRALNSNPAPIMFQLR
jgi:hypothetical protein